jgi:hypothetical protein
MEEVTDCSPSVMSTSASVHSSVSARHSSQVVRIDADEGATEIQTWVDFTSKLRSQFVHLDQKWVARNTLYALRQTEMFATTQSSLELATSDSGYG